MIQLSNITYYPVKACRGFDVTESFVERMGLANDRRMMVVTPDGEFLTQREAPKLALITPTFLEDNLLKLSAPNFDTLIFEVEKKGEIFPVNIWSSENVASIKQDEAVTDWLSEWLGIKTHLVYFAKGYQRKLNPQYAVNADDHTAFADGYPILVISEESLQDLNSRLDSAVPMNRFRPNIVVKGCEPFAEDSWKRIRIGGVEMALVKPCPRCVVTTIDKETLQKNKEPLKTLNSYRNHELGAIFGMNVIPLNEGGIKVGMSVEIIE